MSQKLSLTQIPQAVPWVLTPDSQVSLPFVGPLWVPSDAPSFAHCGLYQDSKRTVFVTSGVGTSILPLRFGAQSEWDWVVVRVLNALQ